MYIVSKLIENFENHSKRETLAQLRSMSERQLRDCGISPELLSEGVKAWPWRELPECTAPLRINQTPGKTAYTAETDEVAVSTGNKYLVQHDAA